MSKFNDTLTGLCSKPPHNNGTVIRPSIEEHSTNVKSTTNQSSYQNEKRSTTSNLPEHYSDTIKAIDFTKFLTNDNEYTLIDAVDLDKHIIWSLNDDGNKKEVNSEKFEKANIQDQLVINDSVKKPASRTVNSDARSSIEVDSDDLKQNNDVLNIEHTDEASTEVNSDVIVFEENPLVNKDSDDGTKKNQVMNGTLSASRKVNSDAANTDNSIFNDIKFPDIDFASVANILDSDNLKVVNNIYDQYTQSMESVNDPSDGISLNDSASIDSYESIDDNICEECTEHTNERLIIEDDTDLHKLFDQKVAEMTKTWHRHLYVKDACFNFSNVSEYFKTKIMELHEKDKETSNTSKINILDAVTTFKKVSPYIYFDPEKYPVTDKPFYDAEKKLVNPVWYQLKNHIQASALESGFVLFTNGGTRATIDLPHREFRCNRSKRYKNQSKLFPCFRNYRKTSMINDRSKTRGPLGKKMGRKRGHVRPVHNTCVFNFTVCIDKIGYHMRNGRGCITHKYHIPNSNKSNLSSKHLPDNVKETVHHMTDGLVNNGVIRNVIYRTTGKILALANIRYLCNKVQENAVQDEDILETLSSVDQMINYFIDKGYDYYCLLHTNNMNMEDIVNSVTTQTNVTNAIPNFVSHCKPSEVKAISKYCVDHKNVMELTSAQHLMIAICWVLPHEKRLFDLYPEVLFIDITSDSNKEKRPLFTVTGRTSAGTMYTLMRAFLPNEKTWIFRWLFSIVLPNSFKQETLRRVRVMITDGDSQEYQQLDVAIKEHLSQAYRVRCGYHLNKKNWEKHGPKFMNPSDDTKKSQCSIQSHIIADWIYSWMKPSCETELQYLVSKYLLLDYLNQDWMKEDCGETFVEGVKK